LQLLIVIIIFSISFSSLVILTSVAIEIELSLMGLSVFGSRNCAVVCDLECVRALSVVFIVGGLVVVGILVSVC
jgi:hypothetical protein